jgi:hypothetical protein
VQFKFSHDKFHKHTTMIMFVLVANRTYLNFVLHLQNLCSATLISGHLDHDSQHERARIYGSKDFERRSPNYPTVPHCCILWESSIFALRSTCPFTWINFSIVITCKSNFAELPFATLVYVE